MGPPINPVRFSRAFDRLCQLDAAGQRLLERSAEHLHLSARSFHRVLKVARTIADLAGAASLTSAHLAEAQGYRMVE